MDKHTPPQEALDSLDEIDRSLHQMLMLAELSASDGDMNRTNLQTVLEYLQRKIDCAAWTDFKRAAKTPPWEKGGILSDQMDKNGDVLPLAAVDYMLRPPGRPVPEGHHQVGIGDDLQVPL